MFCFFIHTNNLTSTNSANLSEDSCPFSSSVDTGKKNGKAEQEDMNKGLRQPFNHDSAIYQVPAMIICSAQLAGHDYYWVSPRLCITSGAAECGFVPHVLHWTGAVSSLCREGLLTETLSCIAAHIVSYCPKFFHKVTLVHSNYVFLQCRADPVSDHPQTHSDHIHCINPVNK